jgi:pimeloyl-ACP methyl ester carboxylesterase
MRRADLARALVLAAAIVASIVAPAAAQLRDSSEQSLTALDGTTFTVTRGTVRVPELRGAGVESSRTNDLAVVRVRRVGSASTSAHIMLAGGPGDSGVSLALGMARQGGATIAEMIDGDIIGIDQRGTGASSPNLASPVRYDLPLDQPGSPQLWLPIIEQATRAVAADFRSRGIRLEAYNTRESADDVDAVRNALGYEKVTLWGRSYGTHLALAVLRRHPSTVARVVLVSPEGPNHTWKLPSQTDLVLQRLGERANMPELSTNIRRVVDQLAAKPAVVSLVHPMTGQPVSIALGAFDIQWITAQALGDPRTLATLPAAVREMARGDFQRVAQIALMLRSRSGVESAMKHMMDLSSGATAERRTRIGREAKAAVLANAINFPGMELQEAWGATELEDEFRQPLISQVQTLILAGDLDARTPVENARELVATLPNADLVVLENAAHQFDLFGSAPIRALLTQFLRGERSTSSRLALPAPKFQH